MISIYPHKFARPKVLAAVVAYCQVKPYCPTIREIMEITGMGSGAHVKGTLVSLQNDDLIDMVPMQARTIHPTQLGVIEADMALFQDYLDKIKMEGGDNDDSK